MTLPLPPLSDEIHMDCVDKYCTSQLASLAASLFDSVTAMRQVPLNPCALTGLYVITAQFQEIVRRQAPNLGITAADLDAAVKHSWPKFILDLERKEAGADQPVDRHQN